MLNFKLNDKQQAELHELIGKAKNKIKPESEQIKKQYTETAIATLVSGGIESKQAKKIVKQRLNGILSLEHKLVGRNCGCITVAQLVANPQTYFNDSFIDPLDENSNNYRAKAMMCPKSKMDSTEVLKIRSFAAGETFYQLEQLNTDEISHSHNKTLDSPECYQKLDLLNHLPNEHIFKRLALDIAKVTNLPESTVFIVGLAVFSSVAMLKHCVLYEDGTPLPIGMNVVAEQPSGSAKSRGLCAFQTPFTAIIEVIIKKLQRDTKVLQNDELQEAQEQLKRLLALVPATNPTPESLESQAIDTNGFVSGISSEQGLFNSLLGLAYGNDKKANNNDIQLNGFDAGFMNSKRMGRKGYVGRIIGCFVLFSQDGGIANVINASNGTGVSERYLCIVEPHFLGARNHLADQSFNPTLLEEYAKICGFAEQVYNTDLNFEGIVNCGFFTIKPEDWKKIYAYQNEIEPHLADGCKFSHIALRGAAGKVRQQIMKVAANLHISGGDAIENNRIISSHYVDAAIAIVNDLLNGLLDLCQTKGLIGSKSEFDCILRMFDNFKYNNSISDQGLTDRQIKQSRSKVEPFKNYSGNKSAVIQTALDQMVKQDLLRCQGNLYFLRFLG